MLRGIERRRIFVDEEDHEAFAARLDVLLPQLGFRCFAWSLMPNHVHLALQTGPVPLGRLMARLGTSYALAFNRRHDRAGHLFQNRFKSRMVKDDRDLIGLALYIHRNPLEARIVSDGSELEQFPWCGHGALVGSRPPRTFENPAATLRLLDANVDRARATVRAWIDKPGEGDIGAYREEWDQNDLPDAGTPHDSLSDLIAVVCRTRGCNPQDLGAGRRSQRALSARAEICKRAVRELGLPGREIARALGVSDSTVSRSLQWREDG